MKMSPSKKFTLILSLVLLLPLMWNQSDAVARAATPTFTESSIEIIGEDETYQLEIKDKVAGSTYKWSSSNTKVARVSSKGLITTVNKGTATIKCKITYPSKKTKTISSKVTVTIPATDVKINNATEVNGAHILLLGEKFNFNRDIVPSNSSYKTYWSIGGGDETCIKIDDSSSGIVTATKTGKVILVATAVKTTSQKDIDNSIINDAIIIEVVGPSAAVNTAEITNSTEIKVVFDSPVDRSSVIGTNNKLLPSIVVTALSDVKGVKANDPGDLTASLSADFKTLTINSANMFDGVYGINFTNSIKTTEGVAIEPYYKQMTFVDTVAPSITNVTLDDTGMIATIKFNEAVDFANFKVSNATLLPNSGSATSADQNTISILNNKLNYIPSEDKKSLTINLSRIATSDYGKTFSITITGIEDLSGNIPTSYTLNAYLYTDVSAKPQARPVTLLRTSYYTITATFDRAIQSGGWATVNSGSTIVGVVDANDSKKVNYTLNEADAALTGNQTVYIGYWSSFNVSPTDTYANQMHQRYVNFDTDRTNPILLTYEFAPETNVLTLTYNKEVNLTSNTGVFNSLLVTVTDEIRSGTNISYTKLPSTDKKVVKLQLSNMTLLGNYTFTIDQAFAVDNFKNYSLSRSLTIANTGGESYELPGPYSILQSTTNLSQIYLEFANMLDVSLAQNISNYSIPGVVIVAAQVTKNTKDSGSTVVLTVADGSIDVTVERPITITGLKGYNGSYSEMSSYTTTIELKDNKKPYYINPPVFDKTNLNTIRLNFNEPIKGGMVVRVTQIGTTQIEIGNSVAISGNSVYITLNGIPLTNTALKIDIIENTVTDMSGNTVTAMQNSLVVPISY